MDCSVRPLKKKIKGEQLFCVSTTDFFFPLIDDPYVMGKIACANVLSDMYAMGVYECDNMLMLLSSSSQLTKQQNDVCMKMIMRGFNDLASEADTAITGGQTVINKDLLLGGVAMSTCLKSEFIEPFGAKVGDAIILTKPLGTQVAVNANQWLNQDHCLYAKIKDHFSPEEIREAYKKSSVSMSRLNRNGAKLMHKYEAHACTDVTGFGVLGHSKNMALNQKDKVDLVIHTLPMIKNTSKMDVLVNKLFKLNEGLSAETSGGLLICLPKENAPKFIQEIEELDGHKAFLVGEVVQGSNDARLSKDCKIIEV